MNNQQQMTPDNFKQLVIGMGERQKRLFLAIYNAELTIPRETIAQKLGIRQLSPTHYRLLHDLRAKGLIEWEGAFYSLTPDARQAVKTLKRLYRRSS